MECFSTTKSGEKYILCIYCRYEETIIVSVLDLVLQATYLYLYCMLYQIRSSKNMTNIFGN